MEIQISPLIDFTGTNVATYTFEYSDLINTQSSTNDTVASDDWEAKYNELLQQYIILEEKYNALLEELGRTE